ncbi:zinc dependent phospholipase C family protein [Schnuerera sp. xch1]|nr:zinc dependent phospholipase C family protein [Schnuerera sp. xch1]
MERLETTYNHLLNSIFIIANPIKKSIKKTECKVHVYLNLKALIILLNNKYVKEYNLYNSYIENINKGAIWADQDFKSSNHFYNPIKKKGLFGRKNAMELAKEYYSKSINLWNKGKTNKAMFYLGATIHLIQDMTVPQHANIRLLDNHHQYEKYVNRTYNNVKEFKIESGAYLLDSIEDYIRFNTRVALKIYRKFKSIKDDETRFYRITRCSLPLATRTTAGALILFYKEIDKNEQ